MTLVIAPLEEHHLTALLSAWCRVPMVTWMSVKHMAVKKSTSWTFSLPFLMAYKRTLNHAAFRLVSGPCLAAILLTQATAAFLDNMAAAPLQSMIGLRGKPKMKTIDRVTQAFNNFEKWDTYQIVFGLMDKRKITLREIVAIAEKAGIKPTVIRSRRRYFLQLKALKRTPV